MEFNHYQQRSQGTDRVPGVAEADDDAIIIPLLGLAGEAGELLSEYKKHRRDGEAHKLHKGRVCEELGDLLWYVANVAQKYNLTLEEVAQFNLQKCAGRWGGERKPVSDARFPEHERFPRKLTLTLRKEYKREEWRARLFQDDMQLGNDLRDLAYTDDGYRYHDVFHLAYAAVLGWSPVSRYLLKRKRKSDKKTDDVEDGGRAIAIEEGISALVFSSAEEQQYFENIKTIDADLLRMIKRMTEGLEVRDCTKADWEDAILQGFEVWRRVKESGEGTLYLDLDARLIKFIDEKCSATTH